MKGLFKSLVFIFSLCSLLSMRTQACSCPEGSFLKTRAQSIRESYCFSENVYGGTVIAATCNCIPDGEVPSSSVSCQQYRLEGSIINASIIDRGECSEGRGYDTFICSQLGNSIGMNVEGPNPPTDVPVRNLTHNTRCNYSCPFNLLEPEYLYRDQPCVYTLRVEEVYKGNYSIGDEVIETGPDLLTSCGGPNRTLTINSKYIVGIGAICLRIGRWSLSSSYSAQELAILSDTQNLACGGFVALPSIFTLAISIIFLLVT